tara:strand:+ start:860 stop:1147 length:288 start_codon:yes stop_codon:yes gene_type:complete
MNHLKITSDESRRLLTENKGELFKTAKDKARRIINTNKHYNIKEDLSFIKGLKSDIMLHSKQDKSLLVFIDYWNLVSYYLRKIAYEYKNKQDKKL